MTLRQRVYRVMRLACAAVVWHAGATPAAAQSADQLFDPATLQDVRLVINARDLQQLRDTYTENTYYPATFEWNGVHVTNVAIRSRGRASRSPTKPGLHIDFDRYVTGQTFVGLQSLALDNLWQDPAFVRERAVMALFSKMGYPAPRSSFARVWINDSYQGVYSIVEAIDARFTARTFGAEGYLFEYQSMTPFHAEYLGEQLEPYKERFEAETHERDPDAVLYGPIHDLFREVNLAPDTQWRDTVDRYLDLRAFVTFVAIETFTAEADGLLGFAGMSNFYLYRPDGSTRHQLIPWDRDLSFSAVDSPILQRAQENAIFRRALLEEDLSALYQQVLLRCAQVATQSQWLEREIASSAALIRPAVLEDPVKPFANEVFDREVALLRTFARSRSGNVIRQVRRLP